MNTELGSSVFSSETPRTRLTDWERLMTRIGILERENAELRAALEDTTSLLELLAKQLENMGSEKKPVLWTAHKTARALLAKVPT